MSINTPLSGVTVGSPAHEWIAVAHWDNMSYCDFLEQTVEYKEKLIAAYRVTDKIRAVIDHSMRKGK